MFLEPRLPLQFLPGTYGEKSKAGLTTAAQLFRVVRHEICSNLNERHPPPIEPFRFSQGFSMTSIAPTYRVSFAIGDEHAAKGVVDVLTDIFFEGHAAVAAFERPDGRWDVTVHFAEPPEQALIRELVANAAGREVAEGITFDTVEAKDWVKASREDTVPVPARRFVVHGQHDRQRVPAHKLSIELEEALAFGTGHHGTTRGCLLLLDHVLKAYQPRRVLDLGTGTGVLGIAAAKALKIGVLASDIDPPSVKVASENARLNETSQIGQAVPD